MSGNVETYSDRSADRADVNRDRRSTSWIETATK